VSDIRKGLSISILIHTVIFTALLRTWMNEPLKTGAMTLDFSVIKLEGSGDREGRSDRTGGIVRDRILRGQRGSRKTNISRNSERLRETPSRMDPSHLNSQVLPESSGVLSNPDGHVLVRGEEGFSAGSGGLGTGSSAIPASTGQQNAGGTSGGSDGVAIGYGSGGANEKTFHYIRDGILRNIKYPDRARRRGQEGRVLLSFTVTDSGTTKDVKVISGSGFTDLDNSAREAVSHTTFSRKIPYRLFVTLPIEFRLE